MNIQIRYFASLREATGRDSESLDAPTGATVSATRDLLTQRYPALAPLLPRCAAAINRGYAPLDTPLREGDELVFIPPLGGG